MFFKKLFHKKKRTAPQNLKPPAWENGHFTVNPPSDTYYNPRRKEDEERELTRQKNLETLEKYYSSEDYLLKILASGYDSYIRDRIEENYRTGKIEELHYCIRITSDNAATLRATHCEALTPIFELFQKPDGTVYTINQIEEYKNHPRFKLFIDFIDRNRLYGETVITDNVFNRLNHYLRSYAAEHQGDRLSGRCSFYHLTYENYLKVKELYPEDVQYFSEINFSDNTNSDRFYRFKNAIYHLLTKTEGTYIV